MMMATLMKLLAIKMVARSFFGLLSKVMIDVSFLFSLFFKSSVSFFFNEKKATSDPETSALKSKSNAKMSKPNATCGS